MRHDGGAGGECVRDLDEGEFLRVEEQHIGGEPPEILHQQRATRTARLTRPCRARAARQSPVDGCSQSQPRLVASRSSGNPGRRIRRAEPRGFLSDAPPRAAQSLGIIAQLRGKTASHSVTELALPVACGYKPGSATLPWRAASASSVAPRAARRRQARLDILQVQAQRREHLESFARTRGECVRPPAPRAARQALLKRTLNPHPPV